MNLADAINKYPTILTLPCQACGNEWAFDRDRFHACTTCGKEVEMFQIEEDFEGRSHTTGAWITAATRAGLDKGIAAYKRRYMPQGYGTVEGDVEQTPRGEFKVRMSRSTNC